MDYSPNVRLEDRLGPNEPPYRSRGEAQVGRLLDRYGIPFFYEMPTVVYDRGRYRVWRPDFTLPTYQNLIVEYAGMPDKPAYMDGVRYKQGVFRVNATPALFVYPMDVKGRSWPYQLAQKIDCLGRSVPRYRHGYIRPYRARASYRSLGR